MSVTKKWVELKRRADRENRVSEREIQRLGKQNQKITYKEAAYQSMVEAYMKASAGNTLPANARQIMYAVRPLVLTLTNGDCWNKSSYFTQDLLPDFMEKNRDLTADWNVVFDARGRLMEPHTQRRIDLGTLEVQAYWRDWRENISEEISVEIDHTYPTKGPHNRYAYALFIEKEGFYPLLQRADLARRYDIAIMSTKGMSVTAARELVEKLSGQGVAILVLHDFDKSGFSIIKTLKSNTRRYKFNTQPNVIDLGLRLADVENLHLESEYVEYGSNLDPKRNLRDSGATQAECDFLVRQKTSTEWVGERVELNAMPSDVFIQWLENKLKEVGVSKFVPKLETLETAYRRAYKGAIFESVIAPLENIEIGGSSPERLSQSIKASIAVLKGIDSNLIIPDNLEELIRESIEGTHLPWDLAVWELVKASRRPRN